jgi:hypothetical protein
MKQRCPPIKDMYSFFCFFSLSIIVIIRIHLQTSFASTCNLVLLIYNMIFNNICNENRSLVLTKCPNIMLTTMIVFDSYFNSKIYCKKELNLEYVDFVCAFIKLNKNEFVSHSSNPKVLHCI